VGRNRRSASRGVNVIIRNYYNQTREARTHTNNSLERLLPEIGARHRASNCKSVERIERPRAI
jgi:hypothetical protein